MRKEKEVTVRQGKDKKQDTKGLEKKKTKVTVKRIEKRTRKKESTKLGKEMTKMGGRRNTEVTDRQGNETKQKWTRNEKPITVKKNIYIENITRKQRSIGMVKEVI